MDYLKKKVDEMIGGGVDDQVKNVNLPSSKEEAVQQLEDKGVPSQVTDKVRNMDTSQLPTVDDVKSKVGL